MTNVQTVGLSRYSYFVTSKYCTKNLLSPAWNNTTTVYVYEKWFAGELFWGEVEDVHCIDFYKNKSDKVELLRKANFFIKNIHTTLQIKVRYMKIQHVNKMYIKIPPPLSQKSIHKNYALEHILHSIKLFWCSYCSKLFFLWNL